MVDAALARLHQLLADLSFIYFEVPNEPSGGRGVVAVAPGSWRPTATFLRALLLGLRANPVVSVVTSTPCSPTCRPQSTGEARRADVGAVALPRPPYPARALTRPAPARRLRRRARRANPLPERSSARLLVYSRSTCARGPPDLYLSAVNATIKDHDARIKLPTGRTITLTAREGEIPISFRNETGYPVHVKVRIESEKLIVRVATTGSTARPRTPEHDGAFLGEGADVG